MGSAFQELNKAFDERDKKLSDMLARIESATKNAQNAYNQMEKLMRGGAAAISPKSGGGSGSANNGSQSVEKLSKELGDLKGVLASLGADVTALKQKYGTLTTSISSASSAVSSFNSTNIEATLKQQAVLLEEVAKAARTYNEVMTKAAEIASRHVNAGGGPQKSSVGAVPTDWEQEMQGSKAVLAEMRKYYAEREKLSEQAAKAEERAQKARERAAEQAAKQTPRYANQYHEQQQKLYDDLFGHGRDSDDLITKSAITESGNAKTLQQHAQAILSIKKAREQLNTTDANYRRNLQALNQALDKHTKVLESAKSNSEQLKNSHSKLLDIGGQLSRQVALWFSVSQIESFVSKIAEVRGEFELQQRSLESLLQNKAQADQIFNKTVQLAVKSPYTIKQMIGFNKQLAAYRIENDKIYDTMKRLADVSAGLGVDMQRTILAYGQVKAAAYLRGTEVRQFTEAGVNMYSELQNLYRERGDGDYSTSQIVDMISKRQVTFEDVEEVFKRLTDEGGLFYNMQEIQSETLRGKIMNLKDSYDLMLNSIGEGNESVLKGSIDTANFLLQHWEAIVNVGKVLIGVLLLLKTYSLQTGVALKNVFSSAMVSPATISSIELLKLGFYDAGKAVMTFGRNLAAAFAKNWVMIAITVAISAIADFLSWKDKMDNALEETSRKANDLRVNLEAVKETFSSTDDIEKRKTALQKLKTMYEQADLEFKIDIKGVKEEDIQKVFDEAYNGYKKYEKAYRDLSAAIEEQWNAGEGFLHIFGDNLETDTKDALKAYNAALDKMSEMQTKIKSLYENFDTYDKKQQDALNSIRTPRENEDDVEYLMRAQEVIDNFFGPGLDAFESPVRSAISHLKIQLGEFDHELYGILKTWEKRGHDLSKEKAEFRAVLNTAGAEKNWNDFLIKHAENYFGVSVKIDEKDAAKQIDDLGKQIQKYFDGKRFTIDLSVGVEGLSDTLDDQLKKIKKLREDREVLERADKKKYTNTVVDVDDYKKYTGKTLAPQVMTGVENSAQISYAEYDAYLKAKEQKLTQNYIDLGGDPLALPNAKKNAKDAAKQQRDILKERLELLKKLNSQYEELRKNMEGETKAASDVITNNREAITHVGLNLADDFVPSKENVIAKLRELYPSIKDFNKKQDVWNTIGDYLKSIQLDEFNVKAKETEDNIKRIENAYSLFKKLKDLGLSDRVISSIIPDLPSSMEELTNKVNKQYDTLRDSNGQLGVDQEKARLDKIKDLREKANEEIISSVESLVKEYGVKLSEQLQLDTEYYKKLSQIRAKDLKGNYIIQDEGYRKVLEDNLRKEYDEKTGANAWKQFQSSESYVRIFKDLENVGTTTLERMKQRIEDMKSSLKGLPPSDLKAMEEQVLKIEEKLDIRHPLTALLKNLKAIRDFGGKSEEELNQVILRLEQENTLYEEQIRLLTLAQNIRDGVTQLDSLDENTKAKIVPYLTLTHTETQEQKNNIQTKIDANNTQITKTESTLNEYDSARRNSEKIVEDLKTAKSLFSNLGDSLVGLLEAAGEDSDGIAADFMQIGSTISDAIIETISWTLQLKLASVAAKSTMGYLGYILMIIETIVSVMTTIFGMHDKKLSRQIADVQEKVDDLKDAFSDLKESMSNAWSITELVEYKHESEKAIDEMIISYQQMIALEEKKKNTDRTKINEYKDAIKELQEEKAALEESEKEAAGGFGSEENYKSAAQAFADAWLDAYNEAESGLDALQDTFDNYMENLVKKQLMLRVVKKALEPVFNEIDEAVDEKSEGGIAVTQKEFADINEKYGSAAATLDETMTNLINNLGYLGSSTSNVQSLQQGIKSITETQAAAIESYLNSIRFFVANEQSDVTAILTILQFQFGTSNKSASSQMLSELSAQTSLLRTINENIENAYRKGWKISNL